MKYMKVGSKADAFQTLGNIRCVASEVASDFTVLVGGVTFHLHKFPLLSKSAKLRRMAEEAQESDNGTMVEIANFPGGSEAFEICAKFCYGISITLNAFNAVSVRCASECLEMTEALEKGNLIFKMDVFLRSCIFHAWKDAIIALKTTRMFLPLCEDINLVSHCIDALATKASVNPTQVNWPFTYKRGGVMKGKKTKEIKAHHYEISPCTNGMERRSKHDMVPKDWWVEDLAELEIDVYSGVMVVIKSIGKAPNCLIGEALHFYALKWLPNQIFTKVPSIDNMDSNATKHRLILEKVITLLPSERGSTPCSFLLMLLKLANTLGTSSSLKLELARMVGLQLEEASVDELLIPSSSNSYDIDLVLSIVMEHFMMQKELDQSPPNTSLGMQYHKYEKERSQSRDMVGFMDNKRDHSSMLVAKLIDGYLVEISQDPQLDVHKFIALAESVPNFARPLHDGLYKAIDVYLKERPGLSKAERKKVCTLLDCKRLSIEACMHAAQNEDLPLRVVVQVLFFDQVRRVMSGGITLPTSVQALVPSQKGTTPPIHEGNSNAEEDENKEKFDQKFRAINDELENLKKRVTNIEKERETTKVSISKGILNVPSKPTFFLLKLWPINKFSKSVKSCTISPTINP